MAEKKAKKRGKVEEEIIEMVKGKLREGEDPKKFRKVLEKESYNPQLVDEAEKKLWS